MGSASFFVKTEKKLQIHCPNAHMCRSDINHYRVCLVRVMFCVF